MRKTEGNIIWEVTEACNPVTISIYNTADGVLLEERKYDCVHEPIFGFDCDDVYQINVILDEMVAKYKLDELSEEKPNGDNSKDN